jgi:hypothetical protein
MRSMANDAARKDEIQIVRPTRAPPSNLRATGPSLDTQFRQKIPQPLYVGNSMEESSSTQDSSFSRSLSDGDDGLSENW